MSDTDQQKQRIDSEMPVMPVSVHAQYVKDFSFENPNTPASLRPSNAKPEMDVNLVIDAMKIEEEGNPDLYETTISLTVKSTREGKVLFISEVAYSALVTVRNVTQQQAHAILYVEVPQMLFPFARQVIANAVTSGGFPPLLLNPIDFRAMYQANRGQQQATIAA
ncbi:MAG: protein-export chaperone SecB [Micavibrio aeruginosavorus]|uniref:Protein-export chaperone SecB n=1 Tax=Micavibrio aeruginosavorus TaxID=349221 RepID=A0A2W5BGV3_9BACT|nr:MAG: protein-export chaperone SecB [Micavibrio aeruginosavorus]